MKFLLITLFLLVSVGVVFGQSDTLAPEITELNVTPTAVDVTNGSQTAKLTVRATDASGVKLIAVTVLRPSGDYGSAALLDSRNRISGNEKDGVYQTILNFPQNSSSGIWTISATTGDVLGNFKFISTAELLGRGFTAQISVTGGQSCTYSFDASIQNFTAGGGSGTLTVTTQLGCDLSAIISAGTFLGISTPTPIISNGTVTLTYPFTISPNTGAARQATFNFSGNVFAITQAGSVRASKKVRIF